MIYVTSLDEAWPPGLFLGYYHDGARTVDVIKASGYRIGPLEVESALIEHPAVVEFVDELPKTVSGKIKRAQIRHESGIEE